MTTQAHEITEEQTSEDIVHSSKQIFTERMSMISVDICYAADGTPYVVMLNSELTHLRATVQTLRMQFIWISVIFVGLALLMAMVFARSIISPIVRMNQAAKQLATGNYDVQFEGEGYRETKELAATLNYASKELSKNDRLQKELIANVSHDLRTPLTMIKGYGEIMRDIPGENTPENMQTIIDETERLSELVNALLDISRLQADAAELSREPFDLTEQLQVSVERYDKLRSQDGYAVLFEYDRHVIVNADRAMMLRVLYNLINNGINYAGEDKTVIVRQECRDGKVRISVIDHGVGISEDQIPLIWDRYYKVDRVHKRAVVGTGLGLSIVKTVLERHRAAYGVDSQVGQGSTFWFELDVDNSDGEQA
jgi:signal transduction histidine kinase